MFQSINDSYSILYDDNKRREYDSSYYQNNANQYNLFNNNNSIPNTFHAVIPPHIPIPVTPKQFRQNITSNGGAIFGEVLTPRNIHFINCADDISKFINHSNFFQGYPANTFYHQQQQQQQHPIPIPTQIPIPPIYTNHHPAVEIDNDEELKCQSSPSLNIIKDIEITMEQSYNGCEIPVEITRWVYQDKVKSEERETIYVSIQKGIDDNEMIELKNKGNILNEKSKGDVKLTVRIKNNTIFTRNGLDLYMNHIITLKDALCGFSFEMTFINNKIYKINNGAGNIVSPGFKKIIKNMGMVRGENYGNLVIEFTVVFPTHLTSDKIEALGRIFT
jgi:DnaJ-class molecular chaperone